MSQEKLATTALRAEMLAEGLVTAEGSTLVYEMNGRRFMAELRLFDVTSPDELCGVDGCVYSPHSVRSSHSWERVIR